jgi:hypothetical protein
LKTAHRSATQQFPNFVMRPEDPLPPFQEPASGLHPEPDEFNLKTHPVLESYILTLSFRKCMFFLSEKFPSGIPTKILQALYSFI